MSKITGRNTPCPCGSGKKYKRCCLAEAEAQADFTREDRESALSKLARFAAVALEETLESARAEFYGTWLDRLPELDEGDPYWIRTSDQAFEMWLYFDCEFDEGERLVDVLLEEDPPLTAGERRYLERVRGTTMRLYEVEDLLPGISITVRDVLAGTRRRVTERLASRSMERNTLFAARIVERGASGQPEIESGLLHIPELAKRHVVDRLTTLLRIHRREHPGAQEHDFFKDMGPFFHDAWISCVLEPLLPSLKNTDGEDMLETHVRFDVSDAEALQAALGSRGELERDDGGRSAWTWSGTNQRGEPILLGRLVLEGHSLELECNSAERGTRGRALIESFAAGSVQHRSTTHESIERKVREGLRTRRAQPAAPLPAPAEEPDALPRDAIEALVLDRLARHYRAWIDEPVPALDGRTPRVAAGDRALRPKVVDLVRGLEGMYQRALKDARPAYDPSWMWTELALSGPSAAAHPPPLAHERLYAMVSGMGELCRAVAERRRQQPGFQDAATVLTAEDARADLELQRFLRARRDLAAPVEFLISHEVHRRKTFWVDDALAYMLAKTDTDVTGSELRAPFPAFALVFTDRHVLSLAERLVSADRDCPVAGQFLRAATVYATEERREAGRVLRLAFALDALGADPPHFVVRDVPLADDVAVSVFLDAIAPPVVSEPPVANRHPLRGLLQAALNSILYATSAGVAPEIRRAAERSRGVRHNVEFTSEDVFFLPGHIEISQVRRFEELERVPSGREILHRFMVRGHWRRANPSWQDQRLRWIEPYWKGPDMAAVIERTYKLTP